MLSVEPVWDSLFLCPYPIPLEKEGRKERKKEERKWRTRKGEDRGGKRKRSGARERKGE